ncbi:MAG: C-type lectin domain-containing protein [Myxococcales bacterium]|nr:C-type lectin domain-containing protein [Myxococcales bacterium]
MRYLALIVLASCAFDPRAATGTLDAATIDGPGDGGATPDADLDAAAVDAAPDAQVIDAQVIDAQVIDAQVIDAQPIDAQPIDARPIDAQPIDAQPIDAQPIDAQPRCVGYQAVTGAPATSRYRRVNTLTLWTSAAADCRSDGGYLVIPETTGEATAVYSFVNPNGSSPFYWAGISDPQRDGIWTTVENQTFANPPFAPGQPNARMGEIYVLVSSSGQFYDWFDNGTQEYACECIP